MLVKLMQSTLTLGTSTYKKGDVFDCKEPEASCLVQVGILKKAGPGDKATKEAPVAPKSGVSHDGKPTGGVLPTRAGPPVAPPVIPPAVSPAKTGALNTTAVSATPPVPTPPAAAVVTGAASAIAGATTVLGSVAPPKDDDDDDGKDDKEPKKRRGGKSDKASGAKDGE